MRPERLELLVLARDATTRGRRQDVDQLADQVRRFAPSSLGAAEWRDAVASARGRVADLEAVAELRRRLGVKGATWPQLADRYLPALGLGIAATETRVHRRLIGRDAWTAAIAARVLGLWVTGSPPSIARVCDAFVWTSLSLRGPAKRCPPELRALFLQRELGSDPAAADRQLRLFVARELHTGTELRAMRDGLVRRWILGLGLERTAAFDADVQRAAQDATSGVFGGRKVFIASLWRQLRCEPRWAALSLSEFKNRLLAAQRDGHVELARADLVAAMDPQLVSESETRGDGSSFHFIVRGGDR
jgi:hypothetical protein